MASLNSFSLIWSETPHEKGFFNELRGKAGWGWQFVILLLSQACFCKLASPDCPHEDGPSVPILPLISTEAWPNWLFPYDMQPARANGISAALEGTVWWHLIGAEWRHKSPTPLFPLSLGEVAVCGSEVNGSWWHLGMVLQNGVGGSRGGFCLAKCIISLNHKAANSALRTSQSAQGPTWTPQKKPFVPQFQED